MAKKMSFSEVFADWEEGTVVDYNNPTCKDCNNCCSAFSFITPTEFKMLSVFLKHSPRGRKIFEEGLTLFNGFASEGNLYAMCLFSDIATNKCKIYNERPQVCRDFHCSPKLNRVVRNELGKEKFRLIGELFVPELMMVMIQKFEQEERSK